VTRAPLVRRVHLGHHDDLAIRARERRGERELGRSILGEAERLAIEVERLERRGQRDDGVRGVEDLAEE
jgi:hypothetical protein